ncbi:MAG: hypothetical protein AB7W28_04820, partial [Armatimonadota bacterium]
MNTTRILCVLLGVVAALGLVTLGYELGKKEGRREAQVAQSGPQVPWYELAEAAGTPRALTEPVDKAAQDELPPEEDQDWPAEAQSTYRPRPGEPSAEDCKAAFDNFFLKNPRETKPFEIIQLRITQVYLADEPLMGTVLTVHFEAEVGRWKRTDAEPP